MQATQEPVLLSLTIVTAHRAAQGDIGNINKPKTKKQTNQNQPNKQTKTKRGTGSSENTGLPVFRFLRNSYLRNIMNDIEKMDFFHIIEMKDIVVKCESYYRRRY